MIAFAPLILAATLTMTTPIRARSDCGASLYIRVRGVELGDWIQVSAADAPFTGDQGWSITRTCTARRPPPNGDYDCRLPVGLHRRLRTRVGPGNAGEMLWKPEARVWCFGVVPGTGGCPQDIMWTGAP